MKYIKSYENINFEFEFKDNHMYIIADKESGMKKAIDIMTIYIEKYKYDRKINDFIYRDLGKQYLTPKGAILYYNNNDRLGFDNFNFYKTDEINSDNLKYYLEHYSNKEKIYITLINDNIVELTFEDFIEEMEINSNIDKYNL